MMPQNYFALSLLLVSMVSSAEELITLNTRPGVEQKFLHIIPEKPIASVILFAGGKGTLNLSSMSGVPLMTWGKKNFLVRSRDLFAQRNMVVAIVDAPSDRQSKQGMFYGFRDSAEHVEDIDHVIRYLQNKHAVPVWLIGTSRGTESAVHIAINSKQRPRGLVLTSSMAMHNEKGTAVTEMALDQISLPTLIVAHNYDECWVTPPEGAEEIAQLLTNAKKVQVKMFSGGDVPISKPCRAMSDHGFLGLEENVIDDIATFIKSNS